jgi:hypothetical protein
MRHCLIGWESRGVVLRREDRRRMVRWYEIAMGVKIVQLRLIVSLWEWVLRPCAVNM